MTEQILHDLQYFLPELMLTGTFLVAIVMDLIFRRSAIVVSSVVALGLLLTGALVLAQSGLHASIFSNMVAVDPFACFFKLLILLTVLFIVVFSLGSAELNTPGRRLGEYYSLLVALTLGMVLMAGASNLLMMYQIGRASGRGRE